MKTFGVVLMVAMTVGLAFSAIGVSSVTQNANSATTTNRNQNQNDSRSLGGIGGLKSGGGGGQQQDFSKNTWELPDDADRTRNPVPTSEESVAKGKELYLAREKGNCIFCHGETGSGNEANFPQLRRKPADISSKERMSSLTDGEVFWKISKGINGIMPAGEKKLTAEERWHLVNYIRTLAKDH